jgi:hypothetical protein
MIGKLSGKNRNLASDTETARFFWTNFCCWKTVLIIIWMEKEPEPKLSKVRTVTAINHYGSTILLRRA